MPYTVPYWAKGTFPGAKSLNLALYADDGSMTATAAGPGKPGTPNGILFHSIRPLLVESITGVSPNSVPSGHDAAGTLTSLDVTWQAGNGYYSYLDSAGLYGTGADYAGARARYQWRPSYPDAGTGWTILCHFIPLLGGGSTQVYVSAEMEAAGTWYNAGARQASAVTHSNCPFYLDVLDLDQINEFPPPAEPAPAYFNPAVRLCDSASASAQVSYRPFDASGETPRFFALWASSDSGAYPASFPPPPPAPPASFPDGTTVGSSPASGPAWDVYVNSAIADVVNFLTWPPMARIFTTSTQAVTSNTTAVIQMPAGGPGIHPVIPGFTDIWGGWNGTTTWTVPVDGLYLVHGLIPWAANSNGSRLTGISVNGAAYWGPAYPPPAAGNCLSTKTQIFSLRAGDTVQLVGRQTSGVTLALDNNDQARMFLAWLGSPGAPASLWTSPDLSFRWAAGTPAAQLPAIFQEHVANDLGFLVNRPLLMAWQSAAQNGFSDGVFYPVTLDTVTGITHGDTGDTYHGWTPGTQNLYTAQRSGWYLAVGEFFSTWPSPSAGGTPSVTAGLGVPTSGGQSGAFNVDWYQHILAVPSGQPPGATLCGMYYLLEGETVQPQIRVEAFSTGGTQAGTFAGGRVNSHMEIIWMSE